VVTRAWKGKKKGRDGERMVSRYLGSAAEEE
jgi:hypothetical protein